MTDSNSSAIVLGASISGLLAARALSKHFKQVTLVERDVLPQDAALRKGVPQGAQSHGLLASGYRIIDDYFPGIMDELEALGASRGDWIRDTAWFLHGSWKLRHLSGVPGIVVSRPCLEAVIRRRVKALPNMIFREGTDGVKPVFDAGAGRVTGLLVQRREDNSEEVLVADLVVDASGRGSHSPQWLEEWGFGQPETASVKVNVGYATRVFERRAEDFPSSMGGLIASTPPEGTRFGTVAAIEGKRWMVTLAGTVGDHPPRDEEGWTQFAASLPVPVIHELVTSSRPLTEIAGYRFTANLRRLYERMKRFPAGYLVIGDALCSFNPIYAQGMSVAAMEVKALDESLAAGNGELAQRYYARTRRIVDIPWQLATVEDFRFPQVEGKRPFGARLLYRYFNRVQAAASDDAVVCRGLFEVASLLASPATLMSPAMIWRVLARRPPRGIGSPSVSEGDKGIGHYVAGNADMSR